MPARRSTASNSSLPIWRKRQGAAAQGGLDGVCAAAARMAVDWNQSSEAMVDSRLFLIGSVDQIIATLERRRARLGMTTITVFEKDVDLFAPIIERIAR